MKMGLLLCKRYWGITIVEGNMNAAVYDRTQFIRSNRESDDGQRCEQDNDPKQNPNKTPDLNRKEIFRGFQNCFFQRTSNMFLNERASWIQLKEFACKNAANALSVANMVMGMASILSSLNGHHYAACWLVLIGYLLDLADGAVARQLNACSALGAKLDDFADFTTFGIATSLLLRTPNILDNILCMCYMLCVFIRLCFFSSGIPFMYRGLPCIYSSAILVCLSLLTGGNMAVLRLTAVAMILFMVSQTLYPHDRVLESQAWKKVVYAGGIMMAFCFSFPHMCLYYLLWSVSYILFPVSLWSSKV